MTQAKFTAQVEKLITEHQQVQQLNPPSSQHWQNASKEINRLAKLIVKSQREA
jgi:hypothetical protein